MLLYVIVCYCMLLYVIVYYCILLYMIAYYCKYVVFLYILVHDCTFLCVDVYFAKTLLESWVWKGFICFKASLPGLKNSGGGWGGRSPPHLQTQCSHHGFGRIHTR